MKRTEKIKSHFQRNKKVYLGCGVTAIVTAVGTLLLVNSRDIVIAKFNTQQIGVINSNKNIEVYIEALGDPGNIIQDTVTGTVYASQNQAAKALDLNPSRLSQHLNGKVDNVDGHKLVRLGKAAVAE